MGFIIYVVYNNKLKIFIAYQMLYMIKLNAKII